jgi:Tol biopolymer transport system component/DNA-binding winged helix-turn-helix (wHTH) protein
MGLLPIRSGESPTRIFRFGPFQLDARAGELRKRGIKVRLPAQSLQVLLMLLDRPGELVTREEIRTKLWPDDTVVEFDPSINAAIKKLREALGDSAEEPRYVETLARRGYRFLGEVERVGEPGGEGAPEPSTHLEPAAPAATAISLRRVWKKLDAGWIAAGILAVALATVEIIHLHETAPEMRALRLTILPPAGTSLEGQGPNRWPQMAVSPDGRRLAFIAISGAEKRIWVRPLDALVAHPLAGTEDAGMPFWSPDNRFLGFFVKRQLKKIDASGGPVVTLCDIATADNNWLGTWSRDGVILFSRQAGALLRVQASGGAATPATKLDEGRKEVTHRFPWFLPDGRHFLYAAAAVSSVPGRLTIRAGSLDSTEGKVLFEADSNAVYSQGRILFLRDGNLMAQPFDPRRMATTGDAVPVAERVRYHPYNSRGIFSLSDNGVLVYQVGTGLGKRQLSWLDRSGNNLGAFGDPAEFGSMYLSPNGKQVGVGAYESNTAEIWLYDVARGVRARFAPGPGRRNSPIWSPDGRTIVFASDQSGPSDLYRKASDGSGAEELLYADSLSKDPTSWSPDGKFLIYDASSRQSGINLWLLPLTPEQSGAPLNPIPLQQNGGDGQFSPDGRWVAYRSTESGRREIYIAAFRGKEPLSGKKWQVSTAGGQEPRWRRDGREIFFVAPDEKVMAAEVSFKGDSVEIGKVRELLGPVLPAFGYAYEVSADGQRFLAAVPTGQPAAEPLTVVENWTAGLKK